MSHLVSTVARRAGASLVALFALGAYACSSEPSGTEPDASPPSPSSEVPKADAANGDAESPGDASAPDADRPRPPPVFLAPADYEDVVKLDPALPFGVVGRYAATGEVLGARWGNHGGPMVTAQVYTAQDAAAPTPGVLRYTLPAGAQGAAAAIGVSFAKATALPTTLFYGPDGMVDLPNGNQALLTYSGSGASFPGEALLYSKDYDRVVARARTNGIYSAVGVPSGAYVYSALSPFAAQASSTTDNGLYASAPCGAELVATGACKAPAKLFGWAGSSGPVAVDGLGNAFVAASLGAGDALYGVAAGEIDALGPATRVDLGAMSTQGTSSIAAAGPGDGIAGYVFGKGYDGAAAEPAYAQAYAVTPLRKEGALLPRAIVGGPKTEAFSVFASRVGDVWIAAELTEGTTRRVFLALRRKPQ